MFVAVVAVLAMLITACAPPVAQPPAEEAPPPAEAPKEKASLSFWNMPFVTQEVSPDYVLKWEEDAVTALPDYTVDNFYGPGKYKDQRDKFLLQAKSGTPDVIDEGKTGLLVPFGDEAALERALDHLLRDGALRDQMGRAGRERLESEFVFARFRERLRGYLSELLETAG